MEYRPGVERCPDCDEPLVDELPSEPEPQWDATGWATVEEVGDRTTAAIVEGFLLGEGFAVRVLDRSDTELVTTLGELAQIEIQVPVDDLDGALAALAERDEAGLAETENEAGQENEGPDS